MGLLRLILALAIVYGHSGHFLGFPLSPGDTPVQIFFTVSGFYMTLVLNEKYPPGSYRIFITNRLFRLFPSYLITLAVALAIGWLAGSAFLVAWSKITPWEALLALPPQVLLVGQDALQFIARSDGEPFNALAPVPQAWTLSLEICFYAMAPFVVRRGPSVLVAGIAASLAVRMTLQAGFGASGDPWSYRFFPSELALFLFGSLGYYVYRSKADFRLFVAAAVIIGVCLLINRWNGLSRVVSVVVLVIAICSIPALFRTTKANLWDKHLGELSYPLYICHFIPIWALAPFQMPLFWRGTLITVSSLVISVVLYRFVETPVDVWRQRRVRPQAASSRSLQSVAV